MSSNNGNDPLGSSFDDFLAGDGNLEDATEEAAQRSLSRCMAGLKAYFRIATVWKLTTEEVRDLLGGISDKEYQELYRAVETGEPGRSLNQDELLRVSFVIGITKPFAFSMVRAWLMNG